ASPGAEEKRTTPFLAPELLERRRRIREPHDLVVGRIPSRERRDQRLPLCGDWIDDDDQRTVRLHATLSHAVRWAHRRSAGRNLRSRDRLARLPRAPSRRRPGGRWRPWARRGRGGAAPPSSPAPAGSGGARCPPRRPPPASRGSTATSWAATATSCRQRSTTPCSGCRAAPTTSSSTPRERR